MLMNFDFFFKYFLPVVNVRRPLKMCSTFPKHKHTLIPFHKVTLPRLSTLSLPPPLKNWLQSFHFPENLISPQSTSFPPYFPLITYFIAFLLFRMHFVYFGGLQSDLSSIQYKVSQGSVPLVFSSSVLLVLYFFFFFLLPFGLLLRRLELFSFLTRSHHNLYQLHSIFFSGMVFIIISTYYITRAFFQLTKN